MTDVSIHTHGADREVTASARVVTEDMQTQFADKVPAYAELTLRVSDTTVHLYVCQESAGDTLEALTELRACVAELLRDHVGKPMVRGS